MIPEEFLERMRLYLGDGYDAFLDALEKPPVRAFRVTKKGDRDTVLRLCRNFSPAPVPYVPDGFYFSGEHIGHTPVHHAGGIYVQDPGAMAAVAATDISPGAAVLDLCAAPGGKSAQVAALIGEGGFLLSNEYLPARAKTLVGNVERLGLRNVVVTSLDTAALGEIYRSYFDVVLCDAPCSGEGMFRKNDRAVTEWSPDNVRLCTERQAAILDNAAPLVAEGGILLYSTCTFSPEENEYTVHNFLCRHPEFVPVPPAPRVLPYTAPALHLPGIPEGHTEYCRRFYPHIAPGEGQFFAVLRKENSGEKKTFLCKNNEKPLSKSDMQAVRSFLADNINGAEHLSVRSVGRRAVLLPSDIPLPSCSLFSGGVNIGEVRGGRVVPHHQLFSAYGTAWKRQVSLSEEDERIGAYLHGEEIPAGGATEGVYAVLYEGMATGGGKISGGRLKNYYPKGLRE